MSDSPFNPPSFIVAVRLYRKERDATYEEAKQMAIKVFREKGWYIPPPFDKQ